MAVFANAAIEANDLKFVQYLSKFSKNYSTMEEYFMRKQVFIFIDEEIIRLNSTQDKSFHAHN
jgi:hypothetical protein